MRLALSLAAVAGALALPAYAAPPACAASEHRQFDFWVGHWAVFPAAKPDHQVANSLIESLYDGCAIRESWSPLKSSGGGSLSSYVEGERLWRQTWVDSDGARVEFKGGWTGQAMILTGVWPQPGHPTQQTRMTYTRLADGAVRQLGETSDDEGKTWRPGFDFIYRKAPQPPGS